jgi:integrase
MEQVILQQEEEIYVPEIHKFRDFVDQQSKYWRKKDEIFIKLTYLLGSRASELLTKVTPWQTTHNKTKPYGQLLSWEFATYRKGDGKVVKILLIKSAIAKRMKRKKNQDKIEAMFQHEPWQDSKEGQEKSETSPQASPQIQKIKMKIVPIVCDPVVEPWSLDILKWIRDQKTEKARAEALRFHFTEMTAQNIVKKCLNQVDPKVHPHSLRHYRITHLIRCYGFSPYQITCFTGWSLKSVTAQMGISASSNVEIYAHLKWQDFIDLLLIPILEVR